MLLTNWLNTLTSRIKKRPTFRSRDRRAIRRRWQTIFNNQISTAEVLEDRTLLTTYFVDDDYTGATDFTGTDTDPVAVGDQNAVFGVTAFATIEEAVDKVNVTADPAGATILVAAGTYTPTLTMTISASVTIQGPQAGVDPRPGSGSLRDETDPTTEAIIDGSGALSRIFLIDANNVTLDGLVITNGTGDLVRSSNPVNQVIVQNNIIHNSSGDEGVQLANASNSTIQYNYIFDTEGDGANLDTATNSSIRFNEMNNIRSTNAAIFVDDSEG
ncbi:MAG: right-handed parallel beta-helix repeat-containing protein, partial [Planctomycetaceae bacterium]|nr:right-handed parallel beta-helix repeat-containing protein [Planctomycetaceae bacterium]